MAALAGTTSIWGAIVGYTVAGRVGYTRLLRALAYPTERRPRARRVALYRLVLDRALPEAVRQSAAEYLLDTWGQQCVLRDAAGRGALAGRWRRVGAWQVLHRTTAVELHDLLADALNGRDRVLQQAAVAMLGRLCDRRAAELLVNALRSKRHSPEWLVMQLHRFDTQTSAGVLLPLLETPDANLRFWAISLLSHSRLDALDVRLGSYAADPDAKVRKAVARAMGEIGSERSCAILAELLKDRVGFVRAHAVRALHKIGHARTVPVAVLLEPLKDDHDWWVRLAVREFFAAVQPRELQFVDDEPNAAPPLRPIAGWLPVHASGMARDGTT